MKIEKMDMAERTDRDMGLVGSLVRGLYRKLIRVVLPKVDRLRDIRRDGLRYIVWQNQYVSRCLISRRGFERQELHFALGSVGEGSVCFDIGANVGVFALPLARLVTARGRVIALEPSRRNSLALKLAVEVNELKNIAVIEAAAVDKDGRFDLVVPDGDVSYAYLREAGDNGRGAIEGRSISSLARELGIGKVDFIKIDVEGGELNVLRGGRDVLLAEGARSLLVELNRVYLGRFGHTPEDVFAYMGPLNYDAYILGEGGDLIPTESYKENNFSYVFKKKL